MIPEAILRETESLRALARGLLGEDADDAVQDGFVAWLERAPSGLERPGGWLTSVVRNLSLHRLRTDRRRRARERTAVPPHVPAAPDELAARRETIEALVAALFSLPEPSREALLLRYLEDLPPREIARRLGVPVETVRTRIKRGLAALRARLDAEHDGDRRAWAGTLAGAFGVPPAPAVSTTLLGALAMGTTVRVLLSGAALVLLAVPVARHLSKPLPTPSSARGTARAPSIAAEADGPSIEAEREREPASARDAAPAAGEAERAAWRIHGRVIDEDARPVGGASIAFVGSRGDDERPLGRATSDEAGEYEVDLGPAIRALAPLDRRTHRLEARAQGPERARGAALLRGTLTDGGDGAAADLVLRSPAPRLRGRIVDASGAPVERAEVGLARPGAATTAWDARSDGDGRYALEVREAGTFVVRAVAADRGVGDSGPLDLLPDRELSSPDVVVDAPRSLSGRAVLPDGSPAAALRITAVPHGDDLLPDGTRRGRVLPETAPDAEPIEDEVARAEAAGLPPWLVTDPGRRVSPVTTGPDGAFEFRGLVPGRYRLTCDAERIDGDADVPVATGTDGIRVVVKRYRLVLRVSDPGGRSVDGANVALRRGDGVVPSGGGDRRGELRILRVVPGENVVGVLAPGFLPAEVAYAVGPDDHETRDEIVLRRLGDASGALEPVLLDSDGNRLGTCRATLATPRLMRFVPGCHLMAPDGDGLLRGLPPGEWRLSIVPGRPVDEEDLTETSWFPVTVDATVVAGETVRVEVPVRPAAVVRLTVRCESDSPPFVRATSVTARRGSLPPVDLGNVRTHFDDRIELGSLFPDRPGRPARSRLEPGVWTFRLVAEGFRPAETVAVLESGAVNEVEWALRRP